jgi:peptide/nickel transport system ATP-binding protein
LPTRPEDGAGTPAAADTLVEVADLRVHYTLRRGALARLAGRATRAGGSGVVRAVDGVSLCLRRGEVFGLVGESGSGKSTLGRALLGLVPAASGSIRYGGRELVGLREARLRPLRRGLQMVFQDPHASLNPAMDVGTAVGHPLRIHKVGRRETRERVLRALEMVGLSPAERYLSMRPADLSGGQKQRVVIARATILGPELLVADEPVSMLDMSVRAKILQLMLELRRRLDLTYLYITHDLATAKLICDRVAIMYLGRIVELGRTEEIFAAPKHPYTRALLRAIPELDPARRAPRDLPTGEIPDAAAPPAGCSYHPRCPLAFAPCGWQGRDLRALLETRWAGPGQAAFARESGLFADLADFARADATRDYATRAGATGDDAARDDGGSGGGDGGGGSGERVRIRPARGHRAGEVLDLLGRVREEAPDEPVWRGVRAMTVDDREVVVEFAPAVDPGLLDTGTGTVACHLFDPGRRSPAGLQQLS